MGYVHILQICESAIEVHNEVCVTMSMRVETVELLS